MLQFNEIVLKIFVCSKGYLKDWKNRGRKMSPLSYIDLKELSLIILIIFLPSLFLWKLVFVSLSGLFDNNDNPNLMLNVTGVIFLKNWRPTVFRIFHQYIYSDLNYVRSYRCRNMFAVSHSTGQTRCSRPRVRKSRDNVPHPGD